MVDRKIGMEIRWSVKAKEQLFDILEYWENRNKSNQYPLKIIDEVEDKLNYISKNPLASIATNYPNTRKCSMGHFNILYKLTKEKIYITSFWDNRQDPGKLNKILRKNKNSC